MPVISIRAYARLKGCTDTTVHKAIKSGKIVSGLIKNQNGRPVIDSDIADREWSVYFDPERAVNKKLADKIPIPKEDRKAIPRETVAVAAPGAAGSLANARLAQTIARAKLLDMEFRKKSGKLVEKDKVYSALFSAGKEVKAAMQTIPDRFIDEILSAPTRNDAHNILYNAIADALQMLAEITARDLSPRE
jgi:hypothetical protein